MEDKNAVNFEEDAEQVQRQGVTNAGVTELTDLCKRMRAEEQAVAAAEAVLKQAKAALRSTCEVKIPELMKAMGVSNLTLVDGAVVAVASDISLSISEERKPVVVQWLNDNGHGDLVETNLEIKYGPGDEAVAKALAAELYDSKGVLPVVTTGVNTARMKGLLRELMKQGKDVPLETLGVYQFSKTTLKEPKGK